MTPTMALSASLRLRTESLTQFAAELKKLSAEEKLELARDAAAHLGVELQVKATD
jgi:hypothetical protein